MIEKYLDDLERRIDPETEEDLLAQWHAFWGGAATETPFSARRRRQVPPAFEWPHVPVNDALEDREAMALQQLRACSGALANGNGNIMNIRANYGTGILSSLFGAELFVMDRKYDTLPTTRPLSEPASAAERLIAAGVPDLTIGLGGRTLAMGRYYRDLLAGRPRLARYVWIYHPDLQGPMDICELLWGSGLFLAVLDRPDLVKSFLDLITETYVRFLEAWYEIVPSGNGYATHWDMLHKGTIMLRDDSAMNFSPAMFEEFIEPYDRRLLQHFGGGAIHFCGKGDHYIARVGDMDDCHAVAMSQPEYNDMEVIFRHTVDRGKKLLNLQRRTVEEALARGRDLHGNVHCC